MPTAKDLVREAAFRRLEEYAQKLKLQVFPKFRSGAEYNKENTIAASACLALVYNRMAIGLATPIDFGWWGEPWLNSLKARESAAIASVRFCPLTNAVVRFKNGSTKDWRLSDHLSVSHKYPSVNISAWSCTSKTFVVPRGRRFLPIKTRWTTSIKLMILSRSSRKTITKGNNQGRHLAWRGQGTETSTSFLICPLIADHAF